MCRVVHFVGFRDDAYTRAVAVFGKPDFLHPRWDIRAKADVAPDDVVVFADGRDWALYETGAVTAETFDIFTGDF